MLTLLYLTGFVAFVVGALFMLLQGVLSLVGGQAAVWWPYGYQVAIAMMVMGIGLMVAWRKSV